MATSEQKGDIGFYFRQPPSNWVLRIEGPNFTGKVILISRFQILMLILDSYDVWIALTYIVVKVAHGLHTWQLYLVHSKKRSALSLFGRFLYIITQPFYELVGTG